jgi:3-mercaptopyruvate sulfurtransferase SseA
VALELRRLGIAQVRPLECGWHGWKIKGYPMDTPQEFKVSA